MDDQPTSEDEYQPLTAIRQLLMLVLFLLIGLGTHTVTVKAQSDSTPSNDTLTTEETTRNALISIGDSNLNFKFRLRIQQQTYSNMELHSGVEDITGGSNMRRIRLIYTGSYEPYDLSFMLMPSLDRGSPDMELAYVKWQMNEQTSVTMGQFKVPATREFLISSGNFQLVDRSYVDSQFRLPYDIGFLLSRDLNYSEQSLFRLIGALTTGEGKSYSTSEGGLSYSGRVEWYPTGYFNSYSEVDISKRSTVDFTAGASYNFNDNTRLSGGQKGTVLSNQFMDLHNLYADAALKYEGYSFITQYMYRTAEVAEIETGTVATPVFEGQGWMAQTGYLFTDVWEVVGRYEITMPENESIPGLEQNRYAVGLNRFFKGHDMKAQFDATYIDYTAANGPNSSIAMRLQFQFQF